MVRYEVDERVGCIAIIDNVIGTDSNGLHSYDEHIIKYWQGVNMSGKLIGSPYIWHVPSFLVKRAMKMCCAMNAT